MIAAFIYSLYDIGTIKNEEVIEAHDDSYLNINLSNPK